MDTTMQDISTSAQELAVPVRTYVRRVNQLFMSPARFFREMPFALNEALTFGILSAWLAALITFACQTINSFLLAELFDGWAQRLLATDEGFSLFGLSAYSFVWSAGVLVLGPFLFLLRIFFGSWVLYFFSILLIEENELAPESVSFRAVLRIESVAFAGNWLSVIPIFGGAIAFLATLVLLVTGVRERFRVSTRRAAVVVLAPYFFLLFGMVLLGLVFAVLLLQFPFQDFAALGQGHGWKF